MSMLVCNYRVTLSNHAGKQPASRPPRQAELFPESCPSLLREVGWVICKSVFNWEKTVVVLGGLGFEEEIGAFSLL